MRTLGIQVKLRRLIRIYAQAIERLGSEPFELRHATSVVERLMELVAELQVAWLGESRRESLEPALERFFVDSLRSIELAVAGLGQAGADLELLRRDFEAPALPLEIFLRGLEAAPALRRSA